MSERELSTNTDIRAEMQVVIDRLVIALENAVISLGQDEMICHDDEINDGRVALELARPFRSSPSIFGF